MYNKILIDQNKILVNDFQKKMFFFFFNEQILLKNDVKRMTEHTHDLLTTIAI